jgi:hypothetical protein
MLLPTKGEVRLRIYFLVKKYGAAFDVLTGVGV